MLLTTIVLYPVAFALGFGVLFAVGRSIGGALDRHPDLVRRGQSEGLGHANRAERAWNLASDVIARELPRNALPGLRKRIAADLVKANVVSDVTPESFLGRAAAEGAAMAVGCSLVAMALLGRPWVLLSVIAGIGWTLAIRPQLLHSDAMRRMAAINRRLPYAIDLAVLLLEAGGTLREALHLLAQGSDPFAEELRLALSEIESGAAQGVALENMAERIGLEDLTTLVLAINRGEETGAPMAAALSTQAEVYRFRRMQRAEKLAVEAPVKMMFPNMIILMAVLLVVLGPLVVQLKRGGFL